MVIGAHGHAEIIGTGIRTRLVRKTGHGALGYQGTQDVSWDFPPIVFGAIEAEWGARVARKLASDIAAG
jgi:hypothetical protein